jgi:hypothetical protein
MSTIYAPGPWAVKVTSFGITTIQAIDHGVYYKLCKIDANKLSPEGVAGTAQVMAAAPELLDALYLALPYVEDVLADPSQLACFKPGVVQKHLDTIRAALTKAGENV